MGVGAPEHQKINQRGIPIMSSIKKFILEQVAKRSLSQEEAKKLLTELAAANAPQDDEIAIVGLAGRFPMADNADAYWELLRDGLNCIRDFPEQRRKDFEHILKNPHYTEFLIGDAVPAEDVEHAHAPAGYLNEIDKFDAAFFGIPPMEATYMDPHQRLALELAWETMEDAGYGGRRMYGTNTGIYLGKEGTNYSLYRYTSVSNPMKLTGSWESITVSRISYLFDFKGPCMLVDTACSAGLVSIHMAAQAILNGECDQALAGGINLSITGEFNSRFQGSMAMDAVESKDATIRTFDARANGTVWGEGVAMVMLKPLARAIADRDHIHAVIKGSAINNDGAASGLTAPDAAAQEQVIVKAWKKAGIDPATLSYVEAHGTGTVLGDPIEFKGLTAAFRRYTPKRQFCAIGSLKTNMGHLVAASGVASLFKVVKSLQHKQMAPTINFGQPNPYINFLTSPLYVNDTVRAWHSDGPRRAALSSFGFSHTNCHMVVEEAPAAPDLPELKDAYCFTLSGQTEGVLLDYIERLRAYTAGDSWPLADLCYTSNIGRGHYAHRIAIVAGSREELRAALAASAGAIEGAAAGSAQQLYGRHLVVSDKKQQLAAGEITDRTRKALSENAAAKLTALAASGQARATLQELAALYLAGADVDWDRFYAGEPRRRVAMPTYPFQRIRVWADPKISKLASARERLHPLVEQLVSTSAAEDVFESVFSAETHWVLADHKIKGTCVVPGTTYLEMARAAARAAQHASSTWQAIELRDVFFLNPMVVEAGQRRTVRLRLRKSAELLDFDIESAAAGQDDWQRHVEGRIAPCAGPAAGAAPLDVASLAAQATESIEDFKAESDTGVFQFGPHWDTIRSAWRMGPDALAKLSLPPQLAHELAVFQLHPSVLDNAMNLISQSTGSTFLPFTYKSFKLFAPFSAAMYSHVVTRAQNSPGETMTYDVLLTDGEGRPIAEITGYVVKKVNSFAQLGAPATGADGEYLSMRWSAHTPAAQPLPGRLLFISADGAQHAALVEDMRREGVDVAHFAMGGPASGGALELGPDPERLASFAAGDMFDGVSGIVFATGDTLAALADAAAFSSARKHGLDALFHLTKALLQAKVTLDWGLCVLTRQAYRVDGGESALSPLGAAVAALGSVIGMEYAGLRCRLVDSAAGADPQLLARCILNAPPGRQIALRGSATLVREMYPHRLEQVEQGANIRANATYLVTGGLGGLGLATAAFIAAKAKARVVLSGRSALAPRAEWHALATQGDAPDAARYAALLDLAGKLDSLEYVACDIADPRQADALLADLRNEDRPLRGVFHLAGVAGDGFLLRKPFDRFDAVLKPKLDGLRNLYQASARDKLDYFVSFSSVTALTGGEGQGDYAAANAFMDTLAWQGALDGRRCVSVNWPGWLEIGMAARFAIREEDCPFASLAPADAFERLERVLAHAIRGDLVQVLPSTINPSGIGPVSAALPFALAPQLQRRLGEGPAQGGVELDDAALTVVIGGKHEDDLSETETRVARIYAAVLGLAEIDVFTNFHDMGGNSIIATHLLKLIDAHFPGLVDISDVFSYSSIDEMAAYIDDKLQRSAPAKAAVAAPAPVAATAGNWEDMIDSVIDGGSIDSILDRI